MDKETISPNRNLHKKALSMFLSVSLFATTFTSLSGVLGSTTKASALNTDYGLTNSIQEGTILHCFDWTYNDIKEELPNIAKAGFTSVQTSPAQACTGGDSTIWYWLYQPLGFSIGTNPVGTKADLQSLCDEAEKYGINIIVDVVANHLAGDHTNIQSDLKDSKYWHTKSGDWSSDRDRIINGSIGMPDIKSEDTYVQKLVADYIQELKSVGVDGIRWDAAKHIGLPSENCDFWSTVIDSELYNYGEILGDPGNSETQTAKTLMKEYTNYMSVTDDVYGRNLRNAFNSGSVSGLSYGNWCTRGIDNNKLVYWGESHDTWSNGKDYGYSNEMSQNVIDRAYAIAASRNEITALYFSRPSSTDKESIKAGVKGSTHFISPEVASVNHFHNAMNGESDYYTSGNNCSVVCRKNGAVIVAGSGENITVSVPNGGSTTAPGTYVDEITGNIWTVTSSKISGTIGDSGVAVIYEESFLGGTVSATPSTGTSFEGTMNVTLKANNVTDAKYETSEGDSGYYTDGQVITIGSSTQEGSSVTVTLSGTKTDGSTITETYTYKKKDPNAIVKVYFDNSQYQWSTVCAYIYDANSGNNISNWPGNEMTIGASGFYEFEVPDDFVNGLVIFVDKNNTNNRYPEGKNSTGISIGGTSKKLSYGGKWENYTFIVDSGVSATPSNNTSFTDTLDVTLKAENVTNAKYETSEGDSGYYTDGQIITIGSLIEEGCPVTVTLSGTKTDGSTTTATYTYTKSNPNAVVKIYFDNSKYNWNTVYAYIYDESLETIKQIKSWPGVQMSIGSSGFYEYEIPDDYVTNGQVIFSDKGSNSNRYPANMDPGLYIQGSSKKFSYGNVWKAIPLVLILKFQLHHLLQKLSLEIL